jgi:hypothetical protein
MFSGDRLTAMLRRLGYRVPARKEDLCVSDTMARRLTT